MNLCSKLVYIFNIYKIVIISYKNYLDILLLTTYIINKCNHPKITLILSFNYIKCFTKGYMSCLSIHIDYQLTSLFIYPLLCIIKY